MLIELAEFSQKLREYRTILERLQSEQQSYQQRRERLSKLSQRRRSEVRKPDVVCYMCNANIEVEDTNSFATCRGCERLVCRNEEKQCCEWIPAIGIWECQNCHSSRVIQQKAGEWLLNQLTSRLQNPGPVNLSNEGLLGLSTTDSDDARSCTSSVSSNQKVKVREFIEELLSSMLNGPLDDVSVGQLMENESYLKVFHRYHSRLSRCLYNLELSIHQSLSDLPLIEGQTVPSSPSDTHFELRKMLQKILDEVAKLPSLLNHSGFPLRPEEHLPYFSPKKYEQLLATAVLNKVVEDYRNPKNFEHVKPEADTTTTTTAGPPTTGATSAGSAPATGTTFDINHNKVPGKSLLNEANLRKMSLDKELKEDLYSRSLSESDESYLSDYIQKHTVPLPDLSDTTGSGPEDDVLSLKSNNTDGTWEENWLFKKRQLKSTESSIAMLVPSPTEEVKALIGDKNADEVSDLSEAGSDVEEYDSDSNLKNTTTGDTGSSPKKTLEDHTQDSLISINSIASNEPVLSEAKNELLLKEQQCAVENLVNDLISIEPCSMKTEAANPALIDSQSNAFLSGPESVLIEENNNVIKQEEVETDDIKLMQERIQNAPKQRDVDGNVLHPIGIARTIPVEGHSTECDRKEVPIDRAQSEPEKQKPSETSNGHVPAVTTNGVSTDDSVEDEMLIPGSIAEREHLKWRNASPIPNNPYSPDVLQKRLEESNRRSSLIDFDRLASRDPTSPTLEVPDDSELPVDSKEEDDAVENDRSLQSVLGANPNQYQRYGRDYYINDAKRACGSRKQTPDLPTQLTHSTDDEKVSQQSYFLTTNSYIMNRFLNNDHASSQSGPTSASSSSVSPQPPPSLRSNRSIPRPNRNSPRPASVDLGYFTKASSNADSEVDIPASVISQFEQEMLHSDFKRDSFRARNSSTRQFVLNPIFDESSNPINHPEEPIEHPEKSRTLPRSSTSKVHDRFLSVPSQVSPVVETVFTDLGTLRRSTSVRSRTDDSSRPIVQRSGSCRSNISK